MKIKLRVISYLLVSLIFSTNMVLSIESIYCICFKTTKYAIALPKSKCCDSHIKNHCSGKSCCNISLKKMPCKASSIITINSKIDFTKSELSKPLFSDCYIVSVLNSNVYFPGSDPKLRIYYSDPSPPQYLISAPFLQSFLC